MNDPTGARAPKKKSRPAAPEAAESAAAPVESSEAPLEEEAGGEHTLEPSGERAEAFEPTQPAGERAEPFEPTDPAEGSDAALAEPAEEGEPNGRSASGRGARAARGADEGYRFEDVVTGVFDAEEENAPAAPPKRVLAPQPETPKLHKVLAQAGLGSRLEMEQLILEGRISVNNEPAHIGQRIQYGDQIKVNGKPIRVRIEPPPPRVIAYHKPVGEVVTHDDPQNRPTVFRKLPRLQQGKWQSVGRLDLNTEGLLLFTNSGELANKLMHPRFGLEREYAVRVLGALSNEERQKLLDGVPLDDGVAQFGTIEEGGGEGSNVWYRVTISEGRNREVRRLFEAVGHAVSRLIRIRYGAMMLPRGLKRGAWMELDERDIAALGHAAGMAQPRREEGGRAAKPGGKQRRRGEGPRPAGGPPARAPKYGGQGAQGQGGQGGQGRRKSGGAGAGGGGGGQPDPMKTSLGYIGADSFNRQRRSGPGGMGGMGGGGGRGGQRRGGGGGGGRGGR